MMEPRSPVLREPSSSPGSPPARGRPSEPPRKTGEVHFRRDGHGRRCLPGYQTRSGVRQAAGGPEGNENSVHVTGLTARSSAECRAESCTGVQV